MQTFNRPVYGAPLRYLSGAVGNRLAYDEYPAPGDVGVLFLHGGGQSRFSWRRAARALQARGMPCLTLDMRGHGDSDWIESGDYRVQSFADDVAALLPQWSKQAILVGASLGALASLLVAGSGHPQVRAVVLFDCAPKLNPELSKEFLAWLWHESDNGFASPQAALAHLNSQFPASEWSLASIQRALRQTDGGRWRWHWDRRIVAGDTSSSAFGIEDRLRASAAS